MSHYTALLDANVLYPAPIRDLLLQLAFSDMFHGKWTPDKDASSRYPVLSKPSNFPFKKNVLLGIT
jgi:hypothetical protein